MNYKFQNSGTYAYFLANFQKIYNLIIDAHTKFYLDKNTKSNFKIIERNYNLNNLNISVNGGQDIYCYCANFENIEVIKLNFLCEINNLKESFILFNNNYKIIFKNLTILHLIINENNYEILENIYENFDNIPELNDFSISCHSKFITKEFHIKFIKKIISNKISKIMFSCCAIKPGKLYSKEELKEIDSNFNLSNFIILNIYKYE